MFLIRELLEKNSRRVSPIPPEQLRDFIPHDEFPNASIRTLTQLDTTCVTQLENDPDLWLDDVALFAFISWIAIRSPKRIVVVPPTFTACLAEVTVRSKKDPATSGAFRNYEDNGPYDVAIIPVKLPNHWNVVIQEWDQPALYYEPLIGFYPIQKTVCYFLNQA